MKLISQYDNQIKVEYEGRLRVVNSFWNAQLVQKDNETDFSFRQFFPLKWGYVTVLLGTGMTLSQRKYVYFVQMKDICTLFICTNKFLEAVSFNDYVF